MTTSVLFWTRSPVTDPAFSTAALATSVVLVTTVSALDTTVFAAFRILSATPHETTLFASPVIGSGCPNIFAKNLVSLLIPLSNAHSGAGTGATGACTGACGADAGDTAGTPRSAGVRDTVSVIVWV
ncbi:MAG: hypothetical protein WCJ39_03265 [bacterium]